MAALRTRPAVAVFHPHNTLLRAIHAGLRPFGAKLQWSAVNRRIEVVLPDARARTPIATGPAHSEPEQVCQEKAS